MAGDNGGVGEQSEEMCGGVAGQRRREEEGSGRETELENRIQSNPTTQHYLQWKEDTLRLARERLMESES